MLMIFSIIASNNCPKELINLVIEDKYKGLSKYALKIKEKRSKNRLNCDYFLRSHSAINSKN